MQKLKYSIILLYLSTISIFARSYDGNYNCVGLLDTYISLLLNKYPDIILPAITYEELLRIAKHEISSDIDLCSPTTPYGPRRCGVRTLKPNNEQKGTTLSIPQIPKGGVSILKDSEAKMLEELRHFQSATKSLQRMNSSNRPTRAEDSNIQGLRMRPHEGATESRFSEEKRNWYNSGYKGENNQGNGGMVVPQPYRAVPGYSRPYIPNNRYYPKFPPRTNYNGGSGYLGGMGAKPGGHPGVFNRPGGSNGFGASSYESTENQYGGYGASRPGGGMEVPTTLSGQQSGLYRPSKGELEKYQQGGGTAFHQRYEERKEKIEHKTFGGMENHGGVEKPLDPTANGVPLYQPNENQNSGNTGVMGTHKQVGGIYEKEVHTGELEHHQKQEGATVIKKFESHKEEREHHQVGGTMLENQQNQQQEQEVGLPGADKQQGDALGFYLVGGEIKGQVDQHQSGVKSERSNNLQGMEQKELKPDFEQSRRFSNDLYQSVGQSEVNKGFGNQVDGLEIIEPGGVREVVKGGQKVLIYNTNCPDNSELCIRIE